MRRAPVIAVLVVAALGLLVWRLVAVRHRTDASAEPAAEKARVRVALVARGDVEQSLEITGALEAERKADVASKLSGKVERVLVDEGDPVTPGQVLAVLDQRDYRAQVAQAEAGVQAARANVAAARARLAAVRAGSRPQELRQAEEAVKQAKASLDNAAANHERMQELFRQGAIAQQQMDAAALQLELARAQYESACQRLDLVREGARREDIRAAEEQVRQAEAAEAQARAALRLAQVALDNTVIRSPMSGVVARRHIEPGEAFSMASSAVVTLVDNSRVSMRGEVSEADIRHVRPGQLVRVRVDALPGRQFTGRVTEVLPAAEARSRAFSVKISIPNVDGGLREGMFARASIVTERRANVILVPRRAVLTQGEVATAFVVSDGAARERKLTLGVTQQDLVEVRQGLRVGERVVVEGHHRLSDGERVVVEGEEAR